MQLKPDLDLEMLEVGALGNELAKLVERAVQRDGNRAKPVVSRRGGGIETNSHSQTVDLRQ